MGYSNVAGDLNVLSFTSTHSLGVRGDTTLYGNLTATSGFANFKTITAANLTVTGNFSISATNTQVSNALYINNAGTATALKVVQYEGGGPGHTHNVAEFWDFQTLAMVIDPEGNVGIHTTASPNYSLTVVDGATIDKLTLTTPLAVSSGGSGVAVAPANTVFAGPTFDGATAPAFRALVNADLPSYISVANIASNGSALTDLSGSNVSGNVANATVALVVSQAAQPNITSVGTLTGLNVQGLLVASNGSGISNVSGSNVSGNVANATVALVVSQAAQPNITSVGLLSNLIVSNSVTTTNIFASGNVVVGPTPTAILANLHVEKGDVFIGNSAITNANFSTTGPVNRLIFDNSANVSVVPNKIVLFSNASLGITCGIGVTGVSSTGAYTTYFGRTGHVFYTGANTNLAQQMTIQSSGAVGIGTANPQAKLQVAGIISNTSVRIDSSNISLVTTGNAVGFGTLTPSANLHVIGNVFASNALQTTNIFAAGFTSNSTNTVFNFDTLTIPFINSTTLNTSGTSNLSTTYITSSNVSGTSNLSQVVSSGQVVATGKSGVGVCPPIVYRQGGSATNWNTPGSNASPNVYAITSGVVQMQCGANIMTSTTQFIPFPVAYTNNPTVLVTSYGTTGNIWVASITSTAFSVTANAAIQFEWMSIGI